MTTVAKYNLYLDSKYRTGGGNPTPDFALSEPITLSNPNHRFVCAIRSTDIPYSFKQLVSPYNVLRCDYTEVGTTTFFVTIPEGNYAITVLCQTLINLIQTAIAPFAVNAPLITSSYNQYEGKVTFTIAQVSGATATSLVLFWTDPNLDILAEFFGFSGNLDTTLSYTAGGVVTSTNFISQIHVNVSPMSSIYLRSSTLTQSPFNTEVLVEFAPSVSDILLKIPILTTYNSWGMYENTTVEVDLNNKIIDTISFYLTGTTYQPVFLVGVHWRVHMEIREVRDDWVDKLAQSEEARMNEIQQLESKRFLTLQRVSGMSKDMRERIPLSSEEPQVEEQKVTLEDEKDELLKEVERNRQEQLGTP
jgi:hypothetical protein